MEGSNKKSGAICLIDAAYVLKGHSGKIDYIVMREELQKFVGVPFDRCIFYNSVGDSGRADEFHRKMESNGFEVKLYGLKSRSTNCARCKKRTTVTVQKGVDVAIVTDLLSMAFRSEFHTVIIIAGDGDFASATQQVKDMWRKVYFAGYENSMSNDLKEIADGIYWL